MEDNNFSIENFDEYMKYFKGLPLDTKQEIIIDQLKNIAYVSDILVSDIDAPHHSVTSTELELKPNYTEDDFANLVITYISMIQESVCNFGIAAYEENSDEDLEIE